MQVIEAISAEKAKFPTSLFLAGGIKDCPDWQSELLSKLQDQSITIYNPRRKDFPTRDSDAAVKQITWEFMKLRRAKYVSFWFPKETVCPISLFELGAALERTKNYIIGMHPDYAKRQDVEVQTRLRCPVKQNVFAYSLDELAELIKQACS